MVTSQVITKEGDTYRVKTTSQPNMPRGIAAQRARARALAAEGLVNSVNRANVGKLQRLTTVEYIGESALGDGPIQEQLVDRRYDVTIVRDD